jgi:AraC-like DNA-binding protein
MSAEYAEFPPRSDLAEVANCVWTFDGNDVISDQPIVPDGRCELIVHCGEPYLECLPDSTEAVRQVPILFAGQVTRPLTLRATGPVSVVAVRFEPAGAWPFLGRSLSFFTDRRVDLRTIFGSAAEHLLTRIRSAPAARRLDIAQTFVADRIAAAPDMRDALIERCVSAIYKSTSGSVEDIRREVDLSVRTLQRRFATVIGVSSRTLIAIVRFRRVFEALQDSEAANWTEAAHVAGYYDLPQLVRDFRRFTGRPPSAFLSAGPGLARSLVSL